MSWTVGVDVGGTFTDFYAVNSSTGESHVFKTSSTPSNPGEAILNGLEVMCKKFSIPMKEINRVSHGTTVGTNALIQRTGSQVALITTSGFRDLLEIGRQTRPHMYDLQLDHPAPLVARRHRLELNERVDAAGEVIRSPNLEDINSAIEEIIAIRADAVAIGFLFSFRNDVHEQKFAEELRKRLPDIAISISSEVQPEFREYERLSTTVLNAYLQPVMRHYLKTLEAGITLRAPNASLGINQSSGGLMSVERSQKFPVRSALSGPAAGVVGAAYVARQTGRRNIITLDMGGTSADVALIRDFQIELTFERDVAGFPIRMPCVDVETVGAGGGSIAWFDFDGLLKAGPKSAGAFPGPACYGKGGKDPTTTDANLILGRLTSKGLLDGDMGLDIKLARQAFQPIAQKLNFSTEKTAQGMLGIVVANMVRTIRTISVERGHDPRDFVLMPFGGAGPLHARDVAVSLGIKEMVIPAAPGIICAQGLLVSDLKEDFVESRRIDMTKNGMVILSNILKELDIKAQEWFLSERTEPKRRSLQASIDARYVGQNFELTVPINFSSVTDSIDSDILIKAFCKAHDKAYGYSSNADPIEIVNVRMTASAQLHNLENGLTLLATASNGQPTAYDKRLVYFDDQDPIEAQVYNREELRPGQSVHGPAILEQMDTTTPIYPNDVAELTDDGHLIIKINAGALK